ncbi:iridoid oxidase-like [Rhododendron vialii]|uniref:iridoid oxidase-like n=1 Tax=Rhododendron vialii TaxID=182163 RepID=UPI00265E7F21|nr:iridoid oxidase-like [Rhododendron vialii]
MELQPRINGHSVVGVHGKVEEKNMDKLPYLQVVVKENLRLHPAVPLLLPRNAMHDSSYMGYQIPKTTQVLVNAWAIGRDPESWDDPLSFKPERFLGKNIDYKGQHLEFIPFGSGRRINPIRSWFGFHTAIDTQCNAMYDHTDAIKAGSLLPTPKARAKTGEENVIDPNL